jgi:hypothetical protein
MTRNEFAQRYADLGHAIQTGVAMDHGQGSPDGSPKHLRVGVNLTKCDHSAIVQLLVKKGVITEEEYFESSIEMLEREKAHYEARLSNELGTKVTLA